MAFPYTPAFLAFCRGAPVEEIATKFSIPIESLKAKMRQEGWRTLANRLVSKGVPEQPPSERILEKIEANRAANYETAADLRRDATKIIEALLNGTLRIKKQWQYGGKVIEYEAEPTIADRLDLANYAKEIADLTYRALGDHGANGCHREDVAAGAPPPPCPAVTVILPA